MRELAAADAVHAARRALERQRQRPGEVALGAVELALGDAAVGDQAVELAVHDRRASRRRARARCRSRPPASRSPRTRCGTRTPSTRGRASRAPPGRAASSCRRRAPGRARRARSGRGRRGAARGCPARRAPARADARRRANAFGVAGVGAAGRGAAGCRSRSGQRRPRPSATTSSWSRLPATATTTFDGTVVRGVVRGDLVARHRGDRLLRARDLAAERMVAGTARRRTRRARGRRACRRASGSLRGSPGAPTRPRRRAAPATTRCRRGCRARASRYWSGTRT